MQVLVTGVGGHIGAAVVAELITAGHTVTGLARSASSSAVVAALGAEVLPGDVNDPDLIGTAAAEAEAVVHLAYDNASVAAGDLAVAAAADAAVVQTFEDALADTGKRFVGVGFVPTAGTGKAQAVLANPRTAVAQRMAGFSDRGISVVLVAIPPVTHSDRDRAGFIPTIIDIARRTGVSAYVENGDNRWPAVHTLDLARLYRLALTEAPGGSQLVGAAEPGVAVRDIARSIGSRLGVPSRSLPAGVAADHHFAPFSFMDMDITMSSEHTRELVGWEPTEPTLLEDLARGPYFVD